MEQSFNRISESAFPEDITSILLTPLDPNDIEIKPDGKSNVTLH